MGEAPGLPDLQKLTQWPFKDSQKTAGLTKLANCKEVKIERSWTIAGWIFTEN